MIDPGRLSLNLITVDHWSLAEAAERCAEAGIGWVAPWRHQLTPDSARILRDAGLRASSLCRGGFFTAPGADDDNHRAVEQAAELGASVLVLVCGPPVDGDLPAARATIAAGIEGVGVVVDAYHVFWDPRLEAELAGARGLVAGHHVSDWLVPTTDLLAGRGLMGDGIIDLPRIRSLIEATGYGGPIEVEVINPALASVPGDVLLADIRARFERG